MKSRLVLLFSLLAFFGTAQVALAEGRGQFKLYMYNKTGSPLKHVTLNLRSRPVTQAQDFTLPPYIRSERGTLSNPEWQEKYDWNITFQYKDKTYYGVLTTGTSDNAVIAIYMHIKTVRYPWGTKALKLKITLAEAGGKTDYETTFFLKK